MNITELRSGLQEHADDLQDLALHDRVAGARRRATSIRRRRTAIAVGSLALALPLAVVAVPAALTDDADEAHTATSPSEGLLPESFAGRTLLDAEVARGTGELDLTVTPEGPSQWAATCSGVGRAYTLHQSIDGWEGESPCGVVVPVDPPWGPRLDEDDTETIGAHTMRVWITWAQDGEPADPEDAVLAVGAYSLPAPVADVAGAAVYGLEESEGTSWQLAHTSESSTGVRTLTASYDSGPLPVFIEALTVGSSDSPVDVYVDGRLQANSPGRLGADSCWLGSFPAGRHTVRMTVRGPAPADTRLGLVWRTPAR
ncbi:putative Serine/arginine repetitive matrix protein 2 [metagenome]|uniref:Putative Serine/arginine repetitive matrix protein 2 n=1 Tax=metagenome TaxID=256318 RepID=A0A2P2C1A4_9ZZZZ